MADTKVTHGVFNWDFESIRQELDKKKWVNQKSLGIRNNEREVRRIYNAGKYYLKNGKTRTFEETFKLGVRAKRAENGKNIIDSPGKSDNGRKASEEIWDFVGSMVKRGHLFARKLFGGWFKLALVVLSSPSIVGHLLLILMMTGMLVYLQAEFYIDAEGKSPIVAILTALLCEASLVVLAFIKPKNRMFEQVVLATLGVMFVYVGSCLGLTVWKNSLDKRTELVSRVLDVKEEKRLVNSLKKAETARGKVSSRDGASAMENARKSVAAAKQDLKDYRATHVKISQVHLKNQETMLVFEAGILIMLRLIFMGVNAVMAHNLRDTWLRKSSQNFAPELEDILKVTPPVN